MVGALKALFSTLVSVGSLLEPTSALPRPDHQAKRLYLFQRWAQWQNRSIPVCWEPGHAWAMDRQKEITRAAVADSWGSLGKVDFTGWGTCGRDARGIRISVEPLGWPHATIGRAIDGRVGGMVLNFTPERIGAACTPTPDTYEGCLRFLAIHEFGHALGFAHEHNRRDTPRDVCQFDDNGDNAPVGLILTPYDDLSIMNYCGPANSDRLSKLDIEGFHKAYP